MLKCETPFGSYSQLLFTQDYSNPDLFNNHFPKPASNHFPSQVAILASNVCFYLYGESNMLKILFVSSFTYPHHMSITDDLYSIRRVQSTSVIPALDITNPFWTSLRIRSMVDCISISASHIYVLERRHEKGLSPCSITV